MTSYISQRNQIPLLDFRMAVRGRQKIFEKILMVSFGPKISIISLWFLVHFKKL